MYLFPRTKNNKRLKLIIIDNAMHVQMIHCAEQNSVTTPKFEETKITPSFFMLKKVPSIKIKLPPKDLVTSLWTPFPERTSLNDVQFWGVIFDTLPPLLISHLYLLMYNFGGYFRPPLPSKIGNHLWTFPDAKGHWATINSMATLLTHAVAHSTRHTFVLQAQNQQPPH